MVKGMLEELGDKGRIDPAEALRRFDGWESMTEHVRKLERQTGEAINPALFGNHPWYWRLWFSLGSAWNLIKNSGEDIGKMVDYDNTSTDNGWIGVDLDGTLAEYHGWEGADKIGKPVPLMLGRVLGWLAGGTEVRIVTARVAPGSESVDVARKAIQEWLLEHVGMVLEITHEKDFVMIELWDDRAVQVIPNTGERVDGNNG